MEIGDIFVVNKADKENADETAQEIYAMISMGEPVNGWRPRVLKTVATSGDGVKALAEAIQQHTEHLRSSKLSMAARDKVRGEILDASKRYFDDITLKEIENSTAFKKVLSRVEKRRMDPYTAARVLVEGSR